MSFLYRLFAVVYTLIFTVTPVIQTAPEDTSDFTPVIRFSVASDTHITCFDARRMLNIKKLFAMSYDIAEESETYNKLDAVLFAGDLTNDGTAAEFGIFKADVNTSLKAETTLLAIVAKAHDSYEYANGSTDYVEDITGLSSDFHTVINGFHFIGLSRNADEGDAHYIAAQRTWLKEELAKAAADAPEQPIFLMHHEHILNTVYGSSDFDGWGMDYFTDIISEYPQVVDFSGHSHYPINDPRSIWQGDFTCVGTGSLNYAEFTVDDVRCYHPDGNKDYAVFWIVEVDANNSVRLRGIDLTTDTVMCEYILNDVADRENRQYTPEQQLAASSAPVFNSTAVRTIKTGKEVTIKFASAESTDGNPVVLYRFNIYDAAGNEVSSSWQLNKYWNNKTVDSISCKLALEKGQVVKIFAENAYGMQSEPIVINY